MQRVRLTFAKDAPLRFIGHLDLVRAWERVCRRANLPLAYTLGFTPHPRLTFAAPLSLGATGGAELLDVYLRERREVGDLVGRLQKQLPEGLRVTAAEALPPEGPTLTSLTRWARFVIGASSAEPRGDRPQDGATPMGSRRAGRPNQPEGPRDEEPGDVPWRPPAERLPPPVPEAALPPLDALRDRIAVLLEAATLPRERVRDGKAVTYDLRPLILSLDLIGRDQNGECVTLDLTVRVDSAGAGRPDEVCAALGLRARSVHRVMIGLADEPGAARAGLT